MFQDIPQHERAQAARDAAEEVAALLGVTRQASILAIARAILNALRSEEEEE